MVWGLFPSDPLSVEEKNYFFAKGTYKVGRKDGSLANFHDDASILVPSSDNVSYMHPMVSVVLSKIHLSVGCDVIITKDKGVSRVHAEILVDSMECLDHRNKKSSNSIKVRIRDCSKYGTFITRVAGSVEKVHDCPAKETALKEGDLISFGTGSALYRFCFIPFVFYVCNIEGSQGFHSIQDKALSIGAVATKKWTDQCTHVIVEQFTPVNDDLIDAIATKKPFALPNWLEVLAENRVSHEIPSCSSHVPSLTLDGASVVVADNRTREDCLKGYTFILEPAHSYKFSGKLSSIVEVGGARTISLEFLDSSSQNLQDSQSNRVVHAVPAGSTIHSHQKASQPRVNEMDLIRSVISGYLDPSILVSPAIVVSSSCSTDETIVADSDAETETEAESPNSRQPTVSLAASKSVEHEIKGDSSTHHTFCPSPEILEIKKHTEIKAAVETITIDDPGDHEKKLGKTKVSSAPSSGNEPSISFVEKSDRDGGKTCDGPESGCSEVLYSQNLITRDVNRMKEPRYVADGKVVNFKRFRKTARESGNSFTSFIPFAKDPFMNSDYDRVVAKSTEEEKKRKKMEAMAEELFNTEKAKRRGVAGSIHALLTRR